MIKTVEISGIKYNIAEATAVKQFELYEMIAARILHQCASTFTEDVDANLVKGVLMASEKGFTSDVADIVLYKTKKQGDESNITLDNFQSSIDSYYSLVSEAVSLNLADFFISVKSQVSLLKTNIEKAKAEQAKRL